MIADGGNSINTTPHKLVLPFYAYASVAFLVSTILLFLSADAFMQHHFHPKTLAITHGMALGWGTMIILGASHQLVPVLIEGKLHSDILGRLSFLFAAAGIPLLVHSFYYFNLGRMAQAGAALINLGVFTYLINITLSISKSKKENIHAIFVFTATIWLFSTTIFGWLLLCNFSMDIFPEESLHYLSLHAHLGIIGWFLLLIIGVGARLIPMFLISKYDNNTSLWVIFLLINGGLLLFIATYIFPMPLKTIYVPVILIGSGLLLFAHYCYLAYSQRIRRKVDDQVKLSLLSIALMILPLLVLFFIIALLPAADNRIALLYGFMIFFGWITAIIIGMTFKTLPFIIWNKTYHHAAGLGKVPNPKELFIEKVFVATGGTYLAGFFLFSYGILDAQIHVLKTGAALLLVAAFFYNLNVFKLLFHKAEKI